MPDIFAAGLAYLNKTMKAQGSQELTYRRGSDTVAIKMTVGGAKNPLFSVLGSTPGAIDLLLENPQNAVRSFVFDCADLDFGSGPVTPENGDEILETINGVVCVFGVMPPVSGLLAWDYATQHRGEGVRFIVHTQPTGTE